MILIIYLLNLNFYKSKLLKPIVDLPDTWLSARLRKVAAREAIDMILSAKKRSKLNVTNLKTIRII